MSDRFDLIIFDCDGVLVDSERVANQVFARVLEQECGLRFSLEQMFDTFVGHSQAQCLAKIETMLGHPPPPALAERYNTDIHHALAQSVEAVSGIEAVLESLRLPYCVASSGSHEKMRLTLGRTDLLRFVEGRLYSTSQVERGKPHPDIYLYAAEQMGVSDPGRCAVVEDSPTGISGAVAAGMTVFGFAELAPAHKLESAGAHHIFDKMHDLPKLLDAQTSAVIID